MHEAILYFPLDVSADPFIELHMLWNTNWKLSKIDLFF